jgi:hypothetical protein
VPLIFVSAYNNNKSGCQSSLINNDPLDFGAVANFIEGNFLGGVSAEGQLGFADSRALQRPPGDLRNFYNLSNAPCPFVHVPSQRNARWFINRHVPPTPPDDD